jgi:hypothetical protein
VQIAQLRERRTLEGGRQIGDGKVASNDLEPMWLDADCITDGSDGCTGDRDRAAEQEGAAIHV